MQTRPHRTGRWILTLVLIAAGAGAAFALDMPVFSWINKNLKRETTKKHVLGQLISGTEEFGQLVPIVALAAAVWRLDRRYGRKVMGRLILAAVLASLTCETCKTFVGRQRPQWFKGQAWSQAWLGVGWRAGEGKTQSFFSGHTSAAFATATILGTCYPPVRPVVMVLATGCGLSRVAVRQHWMSDVYFGALVGMAIGWWLVPSVYRREQQQIVTTVTSSGSNE